VILSNALFFDASAKKGRSSRGNPPSGPRDEPADAGSQRREEALWLVSTMLRGPERVPPEAPARLSDPSPLMGGVRQGGRIRAKLASGCPTQPMKLNDLGAVLRAPKGEQVVLADF
jgi:hypothetical protein